MNRRSRLWQIAGGLYFLINLGGAIYAAGMGEEMHMMLHVFLLVLGVVGLGGWWLGRRGRPQDVPAAQLPAEQLQYLQQSVDAIALEVERVGEAQRFHEKLRAERGEILPPKKDQ